MARGRDPGAPTTLRKRSQALMRVWVRMAERKTWERPLLQTPLPRAYTQDSPSHLLRKPGLLPPACTSVLLGASAPGDLPPNCQLPGQPMGGSTSHPPTAHMTEAPGPGLVAPSSKSGLGRALRPSAARGGEDTPMAPAPQFLWGQSLTGQLGLLRASISPQLRSSPRVSLGRVPLASWTDDASCQLRHPGTVEGHTRSSAHIPR